MFVALSSTFSLVLYLRARQACRIHSSGSHGHTHDDSGVADNDKISECGGTFILISAVKGFFIVQVQNKGATTFSITKFSITTLSITILKNATLAT